MQIYVSFLKKFVVITALTLSSIFSINAFIDPLWYFAGNLYSGINYSFNERESKLNLFLHNPRSYDCIIFGSSATTVLDPTLIEGHQCFNFAFNGARVAEYVDYAKYIKNLGLKPSLILVAADLYNLQGDRLKSHAPEFVKNLQPPPSVLASYLSLDALKFSLTAISGGNESIHCYDKNFKGIILPLPADRHFNWREHLDFVLSLYYSPSDPVSDDNLSYFRELRELFPTADYIGFVPFRSALITAEIAKAGQLEPALNVTFKLSQLFNRFYDFTIPSETTMTATDTVDGFHFGLQSMREMASVLSGEPNGRPFDIKLGGFEDYRTDYRRKLDEYIKGALASH